LVSDSLYMLLYMVTF